MSGTGGEGGAPSKATFEQRVLSEFVVLLFKELGRVLREAGDEESERLAVRQAAERC